MSFITSHRPRLRRGGAHRWVSGEWAGGGRTAGPIATSVGSVAGAAATVLAGRYRLGPTIGAGSHASVRAAFDLRLNRSVAVKLVDLDRHAECFETEVRILSGLRHPGIVQLFDAGVETDYGGRWGYLVCELLPGTLGDWQPLTSAQLRPIAATLAAALAAVHEHGVVHRDIKPANVLLTDPTIAAGEPAVRLADFDVASRADQESVGERDDGAPMAGTARYLAPELILGLDTTPASDVFSLGLVLLEALTGRPALTDDVADWVWERMNGAVTVPDWIDPSWQPVLTAMLANDPDRRPSAVELTRRLRAVR